jgi:hypothetical protein
VADPQPRPVAARRPPGPNAATSASTTRRPC